MNKTLKNVIIYGELDYVLTANFNSAKEKAKVLEYTAKMLPMQQNENGATAINCLHVLNNILADIQKLKANNEINGVCYITIPDKLYKAIQKGTYKSWLKNDGTAKTGLVYPKKEINEWIKFSNLYSNLFLDINFRNLTYYSMSNPRYDIDNVNKHKYLIKQMRQQIEKHKTEFLDEILKNC